MASNSSRPQATAVLLDDDQDSLRSVTCPMCHASATVSPTALEAGGGWRCVRCGQHWDVGRLAAVAAYAEWRVEHDGAGTQGAAGGHELAAVTNQLHGQPAARP